jgi:YD repeat-containing protein
MTYTDAAGQTTSYAYNSAGQLKQITDPLGHVMTAAYDGYGRLQIITNVGGEWQANLQYSAMTCALLTTGTAEAKGVQGLAWR